MANLEHRTNEVKTEQEAVQEPAGARANFEPVRLVPAGLGIPVDLGPGVRIELLTSPKDNYWVMKGTLQPGATVPLHSHNDPEDFYLLSGEAEALLETKHGLEWKRVQAGDFIHIPGNLKHAWRNQLAGPSEQVVVTSAKLGRFLQELGEIRKAGGNDGTLEKLLRLLERYGYWLGSPEENAAVGISLP